MTLPRRALKDATMHITAMATVTAAIDSQFIFTAQYLRASDFFANEASGIESIDPKKVSEKEMSKHKAFVAGGIMQAAAAMESAIRDVVQHGPGSYLGSNGTDEGAKSTLMANRKALSKGPIVDRASGILKLLSKPGFDTQSQAYRDGKLLIIVRNELLHYESRSGMEMDKMETIDSFRRLNLPKPPFVAESSNFFPHHFLSASCARWAIKSSEAFLRDFFGLLGFPVYLDRFDLTLR